MRPSNRPGRLADPPFQFSENYYKQQPNWHPYDLDSASPMFPFFVDLGSLKASLVVDASGPVRCGTIRQLTPTNPSAFWFRNPCVSRVCLGDWHSDDGGTPCFTVLLYFRSLITLFNSLYFVSLPSHLHAHCLV